MLLNVQAVGSLTYGNLKVEKSKDLELIEKNIIKRTVDLYVCIFNVLNQYLGPLVLVKQMAYFEK